MAFEIISMCKRYSYGQNYQVLSYEGVLEKIIVNRCITASITT